MSLIDIPQFSTTATYCVVIWLQTFILGELLIKLPFISDHIKELDIGPLGENRQASGVPNIVQFPVFLPGGA